MDAVQPPDAAVGDARNGVPLCAEFVNALPVAGASITVFGRAGAQLTICASDAVAARGDSLQFELGEGPHWQSLATGKPVLCSDLAEPPPEWPIFSAAAREIGMGSVFAFPLTMGAVVFGAVDLYGLTSQMLEPDEVSLAASMAGRVTAQAVSLATLSANDPASTEHRMAPALRREVHQATGMIQVQLNSSATEAFARLRAHAFSSGRAMEDIAGDVVARRLDFSELPD